MVVLQTDAAMRQPSVLDAIARARQLDDAEQAHLIHLAQEANGSSVWARPRRHPARRWTPRPSLQWVLDTITAGPAIVRNGRMDLLATNHLGRAMHSSLYDRDPTGQPNFARYTFLDDDSRRFYPAWDTAADTCVAILRTEAGRNPHDKALHDLVGELSTGATTSDAAGAPTTSACTAPVPNNSTTALLATSTSPTKASA